LRERERDRVTKQRGVKMWGMVERERERERERKQKTDSKSEKVE
jgi:hypothetical protein